MCDSCWLPLGVRIASCGIVRDASVPASSRKLEGALSGPACQSKLAAQLAERESCMTQLRAALHEQLPLLQRTLAQALLAASRGYANLISQLIRWVGLPVLALHGSGTGGSLSPAAEGPH